jgi:hypothetical protein
VRTTSRQGSPAAALSRAPPEEEVSVVTYELREQYITPEDCEPFGLWHIVETGRLRALCGHTVDTAAAARALAELAEIDPNCYCDPCTQIHQGAAGRALDQDWHNEPPTAKVTPDQEFDPGPW